MPVLNVTVVPLKAQLSVIPEAFVIESELALLLANVDRSDGGGLPHLANEVAEHSVGIFFDIQIRFVGIPTGVARLDNDDNRAHDRGHDRGRCHHLEQR